MKRAAAGTPSKQDLVIRLITATEKAYEFAPGHYTWEACCAAKAVAQQIRKESTQPKS